jgi:acetolactate synthase-1/2/3 large subunit
MKKKVATWIIDDLCEMGFQTFFVVSGGAALHLLHAIDQNKNAKLITVNHEQSVAMAVEAYSRISGQMAVGIVTSGPGATNLVTGVAGAYYDSIASLYITGQVATFRQSTGLGIRQYGFQETNVSDIFATITKKVLRVDSAISARQNLQNIIDIATQGRPGPVVLDIPDDIQREYLESEQDLRFGVENRSPNPVDFINDASEINNLISESKKPLLICGAGIGNLKFEDRAFYLEFMDKLRLPVTLSWGAKSLVPYERKYLVGTFGTHGNRNANRAIQNSDLLLILGCRLDTKATGTPAKSFAPNATKIMIDLDINEYRKFEKFDLEIDVFIEMDFSHSSAKLFFDRIFDSRKNTLAREKWRIEAIQEIDERPFRNSKVEYVEPYEFIMQLAAEANENTRVIIDTGCAIAWTMQAWRVKEGQVLLHDFNNTAMGWSISASLASSIMDDDFMTICLVGDGSLMMGLPDLATLKKYGKRLIIFVLNNSGHSMIKQTQDQWFEGDYVASQNLAFPNYEMLAKCHGLHYRYMDGTTDKLTESDLETLATQLSMVEVKIDPMARVVPQNRFGFPIDVMEPENEKLWIP